MKAMDSGISVSVIQKPSCWELGKMNAIPWSGSISFRFMSPFCHSGAVTASSTAATWLPNAINAPPGGSVGVADFDVGLQAAKTTSSSRTDHLRTRDQSCCNLHVSPQAPLRFLLGDSRRERLRHDEREVGTQDDGFPAGSLVRHIDAALPVERSDRFDRLRPARNQHARQNRFEFDQEMDG